MLDLILVLLLIYNLTKGNNYTNLCSNLLVFIILFELLKKILSIIIDNYAKNEKIDQQGICDVQPVIQSSEKCLPEIIEDDINNKELQVVENVLEDDLTYSCDELLEDFTLKDIIQCKFKGVGVNVFLRNQGCFCGEVIFDFDEVSVLKFEGSTIFVNPDGLDCIE
ncbi:hypothetical protein [Clostridium ganghwense]|uniref:Uncharacterized protein n=1 Tax=Clostridium ganghwense TaxID=312089 RepID=A0ABT4CKV6_9CLOT|nr:hypothetical protein [Clostridium ganghwense]MCY6369675.1 hypothetical protein [Clostridium ganghwense]